jgi:hypothetical protein
VGNIAFKSKQKAKPQIQSRTTGSEKSQYDFVKSGGQLQTSRLVAAGISSVQMEKTISQS